MVDALGGTTALKTFARGFAAPRAVAGDFNASYDSSNIGSMTAVEYYDVWAQANPNNPGLGTQRSGWRPDYIFRTRDTMLSVVSTMIAPQTNPATGHDVSDHFPMVVTFRVQ